MNTLDEAALARLRELAEKATPHGPIQPWRDFRDAFMPPTVLALLDMVERQRKALNSLAIADDLDANGYTMKCCVICDEFGRKREDIMHRPTCPLSIGAASSTEERA